MEYLRTKEEILKHFLKAKLNNTLYRTCLFVGAEEFLEKEIIPEFLKLLECKDPKAPCGHCSACIKVENNCHPDIMFFGQENKAISMEQVRNMIYESSMKPWEGTFKIFVLYNIHQLREEIANALLKTLEEPSDHCVYILTTENEQAVLDTIRSRCQIFHIGGSATFEDFKQTCGLDNIIAETIWILSNNDITTAEEILRSQWEGRCKMMQAIIDKKDPIDIGNMVTEICGSGEAGKEKTNAMILHFASLCHDLLVLKNIEDITFLFNKDLAYPIQQLSKQISTRKIESILDFLWEMRQYLNYNINLGLFWENLFLLTY
ncbi:MAG: DNA polymerase III subunit [Planctomycetes bacterium]|jgi:DNA polymerase-3 subunit delta'|nr:DNA polymerase III subunit [Planctomycetota bacterium]HPY74877.1 DNA polymerase III subunit delta' C-terminal domain-containing protein [Planctomycetota bacterium]HQB00510.1 DNA polymerase III subunit delta' C-terminal domain-containing protein [Planctomycetota bacterium]